MKSNIRKLRNERQLSQTELAKIIGSTQQSISYMERDRDRIPIESLIKLADYFDVSTDYILGVEKDRTSEKSSVTVSGDGEALKKEIDNLSGILNGKDNKVLYELLLSLLLYSLKDQIEAT